MCRYGLLAVVVLMCLGMVLGCTPQRATSNSATTKLDVFDFFSQPVINRLAHHLVNDYHPASGSTPARLGWEGVQGSYLIMGSVRAAVYHDRYEVGDVEQTYKPAFLSAVKFAAGYPSLVRMFYGRNVDRITSEMVAYAKQPVTEKWYKREAYSDEQIAEMFRLYAEMAERAVPVLRLAMSADDKTRSLADSLAMVESQHDWAKTSRIRSQLMDHLGCSRDGGKYKTWQFGYRQYQKGGANICMTIIDITKDAATRARRLAKS